MSLRYIGSKARLAGTILDALGRPGRRNTVFVDAFCGTGAVAEAAADRGWEVLINDSLYSATLLAGARLVDKQSVRFRKLGGYAAAIEHLSALRPVHGFIWREYSPASSRYTRFDRRYFTEANASRIDAIRRRIATWHSDRLVTDQEHRLLLADLLEACNRVANTAGTYGCFLRHWSPPSLRPIALRPRSLRTSRVIHTVRIGDAELLEVESNDVVYLDPPYTKRQYAAYYHILETVAYGDSPTVSGVTGLRSWQEKSSAFCYRRKALGALESIVARMACKRMLISYSDEGHIELTELRRMLKKWGDVRSIELESIGRYRPNVRASATRSIVREYLVDLHRAATAMAA